MPEILNYTYETEYITVDTNSSWDEADVDADGIPDTGLLPIMVKLYPTNTATHTISAWDFTISGSGPDMGEGAASGQPFFGWDLGGAMGIVTGWNQVNQAVEEFMTGATWTDNPDSVGGTCNCLPPSVKHVIGYNTQEPHTVGNEAHFLVYLYDDVQISEEDLVVILDLDGDAQPIQSGQDDPNTFWLVVRLAEGVESGLSLNWKYWKSGQTGTSNWQLNDIQYSEGTEFENWLDDNGVGPTEIKFKYVRAANSFDLNLPISNDTLYNTQSLDFLIKPRAGYTVSRHNLSFKYGNSSYSTSTLSTQGTFPYANSSVEDGAIWLQGQEGNSMTDENWCPNGQGDENLTGWNGNVTVPQIGDGVYAATFYAATTIETLPHGSCGGGEYPLYSLNDTSQGANPNYWPSERTWGGQPNPTPDNPMNFTSDTSWFNSYETPGWTGSNSNLIKNHQGNETQIGALLIDIESGPQTTAWWNAYSGYSPDPSSGTNDPGYYGSRGSWVGPCGSCGETLETHPIFPSQTDTGYIPDFACGSDYLCNGVLMGLVGFSQYIPGSEPRDIIVTIHGAAMPLGDESCEDFDVQIDIQ